jgi:hypothetical protein
MITEIQYGYIFAVEQVWRTLRFRSTKEVKNFLNGRYLSTFYSMFKFFFVIPAKAGHEVKLFSAIQRLQTTSWIPGLRFAAPGMTHLL